MNKVLTTIALSLSAMIATTSMAGSQDLQDRRYYPQQNHYDNRYDHNDRYNHGNKYDRYDRYNKVNPSREWRSGQYLPNQFQSSRYAVNYQNFRHLPKPGRNQQWLKINGDYVLVNERNNRIIRIVG